MCGICGIASSAERRVDHELVQTMNQAIAHRGPDGDGFYSRPQVGLAMRRLAIIDVAGGDQPIANEDESLWIVFNGEVYNFPALREQLDSMGHQFRTNTDTECLLHLYEEYGDNLVEYLRGMFAFAIWDEKQQRLLIARDRFGKKPLYYTVQDGTLYFSSEMNSLLAALPRRPKIWLPAINMYLSLQYVPEPYTPYENIYKLPAAHRMVWQNGELAISRYWELNYEPKLTDPLPDLLVELRAQMRKAVHMRMISEVPLGAHLSGGIDSSIIVALMAEASNQPVKTFSVGFEETAFSELPYARAVAERYATDHHEFTLTFGDVTQTLGKLLAHVGEPFADPSALPMYHLSELTRQHVTVVLNGDGGDEAFAGYQRYWFDPWGNAYLKLPSLLTRKMVPGIVGLLPDRADRPVGGSLVNGLKRLSQLAEIDARASILRWGSYFSGARLRGLWKPGLRAELDFMAAENLLVSTFDKAKAASYLDRTLYTDIHTYLPGDLLVKADRMTMAHSLEGRSPFLDHVLAGWAARLPAKYRTRGLTGKWILREAFKAELPDEITGRGKQGFGIPIGAWFRGPLVDWSKELLLAETGPLNRWFQRAAMENLLNEHLSGRVDHGKKLWALAALAVWAEGKV